MTHWCGIEGPFTALVIGARGGIGAAFVEVLSRTTAVQRVIAVSRDSQWASQNSPYPKVQRIQADIVDENSLAFVADKISNQGIPLRFAINCSGLLHDGDLQPERTWRHLDLNTMRRVFDVNAFGVALFIKRFLPLLPRQGRTIFATLSARIGSISDNRIGGWYSYRASKAAQNMIVKTAAIEASRKYPELALIALHPGTVKSALSDPFTKRLPSHHQVFTPQDSCQKLCVVLKELTSENTGRHFAWDGSLIPA